MKIHWYSQDTLKEIKRKSHQNYFLYPYLGFYFFLLLHEAWMCYTFNMYRELLGRTNLCPVRVGVSHISSLVSFRQTRVVWPPKGHLYSSLTTFTFERGCYNWKKPENAQLQSESDPYSLIRAMSAECGLFSRKEDPNRTSVPKLVTWS